MLTIGTEVRIKPAPKNYYKEIKIKNIEDWIFHTEQFISFLGNRGIITSKRKEDNYLIYIIKPKGIGEWPLKAFSFLEKELEPIILNYNE